MSDNYIILEFYVAYQFKEIVSTEKKLSQESVKQKKITIFFSYCFKTFIDEIEILFLFL